MRKQILKKTILIAAVAALGLCLHGKIDFKNSRGFDIQIAHADGAVENLDEVVARKTRQASASWGYALLQDNANNYTWQPETLSYSDATTGSEVWKFSNTPSGTNTTQDIGITHWSANGNRALFHSTRATDAFAYANGTNQIWMLSNTDGSRLKPAKGAAAQLATLDKYPLWSPVLADVYYQGYSNDGQSTLANVLYKVTASDTTISRSVHLTLPAGVAGLLLKKAISGDGTKILARDFSSNTYYPLTVFPEASKAIDDVDGYNGVINFDLYWGGTVSWSGYHDKYLTGAAGGIDGIWNILMPETSAYDGPFWRARLTGSAADGGPLHTQDRESPYNWGGEVEPVNTVTDFVNKPSPWCADGSTTPNGTVCIDSSGHGNPDRWAHYLIGADPNDGTGYGLSFLNMRSHVYSTTFKDTIHNINHPDWEAWSDWSVASGSPRFDDPTAGPTNPQSIVLQNYNDAGSQRSILYTHSRYNETASPPYEANARPTQSPDGTKAMFNSTFLNASDNDIQLFWTVAYYPYPPQIKSATKVSSNVRLTWDFNQGSNCSNSSQTTPRTGPTPNFTDPRTYATRGWPHETQDCPPSPREIKNFRIWSSTDNSTWSPLGTTTYNNCSGSNECGMWTETQWNFDAAQPNNTTRYYAITSLEHSGLESKTLSNVWKVTTDESGNITEQTQQSTYPADPGAKSNFFTTNPDAPQNITATHKLSPATADGQYTLTWTAPTNHDLIRYYNIYAEDGSEPTAIQQNRIASIAATSDYDADNNFSYVDWLGNTDGSTQYKITAVDYQGNESGVMDTVAPGAPSGLSVS